MFLMMHNLCMLYPGLTPFEVEETGYAEVIALFADVRRMQIREEGSRDSSGNRIIRRQASDDAGWW